MWAELVEWARRSELRPGFELVNPEELTIPVKTADEATAILGDHHARWRLAPKGAGLGRGLVVQPRGET